MNKRQQTWESHCKRNKRKNAKNDKVSDKRKMKVTRNEINDKNKNTTTKTIQGQKVTRNEINDNNFRNDNKTKNDCKMWR